MGRKNIDYGVELGELLEAVLVKSRSDGPEIVNIFDGWQVGDWVWCVHCRRCYRVGEFRVSVRFIDRRRKEVKLLKLWLAGELEDGPDAPLEVLQMCPYADCEGDAVIDAWHWLGDSDPDRGKVYESAAGNDVTDWPAVTELQG